MSVSLLCQSCALCCDGSLFATVPVEEREVAEVSGAGLSVLTAENGKRSMPQPCSALDGSRCSVYESRPSACRRFDCLLASALKEGELGLEEAASVVSGARELISRVEAALPDSEPLRSAREELERYLRRHFLGRFG